MNPQYETALPETPDEAARIVKETSRLFPIGATTKWPEGTHPGDARPLSLARLDRILEYDPTEYTITAQAGCPLSSLNEALAGNGQHLPFDPPLVAHGATIGGTVAAGLSGPGCIRHGGIRDFILGIRMVDGRGRIVRGGGKVVKNAAGFDLPKLVVGSLGRLGVLTEITLKVFPHPPVTVTLSFECGGEDAAHQALLKLRRSAFVLDALEWDPPARLLVRLGGPADAMEARIARLRETVGHEPDGIFREADDADLWGELGAFGDLRNGDGDAADTLLVKVPLTPSKTLDFVRSITGKPARFRISAAGTTAWMAWHESPEELASCLQTGGHRAVAFHAPGGPRLVPEPDDNPFLERIRSAIDPDNRFPPFASHSRKDHAQPH